MKKRKIDYILNSSVKSTKTPSLCLKIIYDKEPCEKHPAVIFNDPTAGVSSDGSFILEDDMMDKTCLYQRLHLDTDGT